MAMSNLATFSIKDMVACGDALRGSGAGAQTMEEAGQRMVRRLYETFGDGAGSASALVRLYKTHPYGALGARLKAFADGILSDEPRSPTMRCLTLLATAGDNPAWNDRRQSVGHQAIPLPSAKVVERLPMVAQ